MSIYSINPRELNVKLAEELKKIPEIVAPEWALYVKSSVARERPPADEDFWQKRAASILRQLYLNHSIGVNKLRNRYGGRKNRGAKPARFKKGSGKIIRVLFQQMETAELVQKTDKKKGRMLTDKGKKLIEKISGK